MSISSSISINKSPLPAQTLIAPFKDAYLQQLTAPLDGYWEAALIGQAPHYEIREDESPIGYCAITDEQELLQIYTTSPLNTSTALKQLWETSKMKTAVIGTNDPLTLANCLKLSDNPALTIHTYLFQDSNRPTELYSPNPDAQFRLATMDDLEALINFYNQNNEYEDTDAIEDGFGGHHQYTKTLIENKQVFLLTDETTIFGIGECRFSQTQPPFADVGMIVNKAHRRQQFGTTILIHLKNYCYQLNRKPICSCEAKNIASLKTIEKAGFCNSDRLLSIKF